MELQLTGPHRATYNTIFHHPIARNLPWQDVRSMLGAMAEVVDAGDGKLQVTRNGQTAVFQPPQVNGATDVAELIKLREFIGRSAAPAAQSPRQRAGW